jgi:hypothetical protein
MVNSYSFISCTFLQDLPAGPSAPNSLASSSSSPTVLVSFLFPIACQICLKLVVLGCLFLYLLPAQLRPAPTLTLTVGYGYVLNP